MIRRLFRHRHRWHPDNWVITPEGKTRLGWDMIMKCRCGERRYTKLGE